MNFTCLTCSQKQSLIKKYQKLIRLLKTKCDKTKSLLKNQTLTSEIQLQPSQDFPKSVQSDGIQNDSKLNDKIFDTSLKMTEKKLALVVIQKKLKKTLLKQCFTSLKSAAKISTIQDTFSFNINASIEIDSSKLKSLIDDTLKKGASLQISNDSNLGQLRQLHFKVFQLELKNSQFSKKIKSLEKQLSECEKRFTKQTQKKRESLQTVAQQIRQKCQLVFQLQQLVKRYQKTLGKSLSKIDVQNVLIEDEQQLKKTCERLQSINDKVNCDLKIAQIELEKLNAEFIAIQTQRDELKVENKTLKQSNFELSQQVHRTTEFGECYKSLCQKLNKKICLIKNKEKQVYENTKLHGKCNSLFSSTDIVSSKNTQASSQSPLSRKSSLKQFDTQIKIQQIYSFIFNIEVEEYKIMNEQIFDKDELALLKSHKNIFLNSKNSENHQKNLKTQKLIKKDNLNETDLIFYIQSPQTNVENSFFNVLQHETQTSKVNMSPANVLDNMKLINLEIDKSKLIQKISELKNLHMHIRNVFLNFLKTIDLSSCKNETQSILQVIYEFFQYSQDQKMLICKQKKKKFWGIL